MQAAPASVQTPAQPTAPPPGPCCPVCGAALAPLSGAFRCTRCCFTLCAGCEAIPMGADAAAGDY